MSFKKTKPKKDLLSLLQLLTLIGIIISLFNLYFGFTEKPILKHSIIGYIIMTVILSIKESSIEIVKNEPIEEDNSKKGTVLIYMDLVEVFDESGDRITEASFYYYNELDYDKYYALIKEWIGNDFEVIDKRKK